MTLSVGKILLKPVSTPPKGKPKKERLPVVRALYKRSIIIPAIARIKTSPIKVSTLPLGFGAGGAGFLSNFLASAMYKNFQFTIFNFHSRIFCLSEKAGFHHRGMPLIVCREANLFHLLLRNQTGEISLDNRQYWR